ncbi:MAG: hypothetical protein AAB619_04335 [Patescibacteria group bacterium]
MSLVRFLVILGFGTLLSWTAWMLVLTTLDPASGGLAALFLFYGSFFLALFGTATIAGFFTRYWLERQTVLFRQIAVALRHGTLISAGSTLALLLQSRRLLNLWAVVALVALVVVIELFFLAGQTRRPATE